jgi:PAS domain S-box-containing protein
MNGKHRIILAFCVCLLLLILAGGYSYLSTSKYEEASDWVDHSQELVSNVESVYTAVREMEANVRGYVITNEQHYLGPFERAVTNSRESLRTALKLVEDNPKKQQLLREIGRELEAKIDFSHQVVKQNRDIGFDAAQQLILSRRGENLLASMHEQIDRLVDTEKQEMNFRMKEEESRATEVLFDVIAIVLLSILILSVTLYFFVKDYNKRKKSEELVKEGKLRFKKILESIPIGVFVLTADGKPYFMNKNAARILGVDTEIKPDEELLIRYNLYQTGTNELIPVSDLPLVKALRGESTFGNEDLEIERDGQRVRLRINSLPLYNSNHQIEFAITMFEDISELKKNESELVGAKQLAEESLLLKETFLANMSHEIRTPMNAILGFTDLLLNEPIREKERDYVQTIRNAGESLLRIINDILDLSKIEANMMEFEAQPLNIPDTLRSLQTMMLPKAEEKRLELFFSCDARLSRTLIGDPTRLTQIIINLVGNAIKFTRKGNVSVDARVIDEDTDNCMVRFTVTDTGIGIPKDKLDTIFERFRQAEAYTSRSYGGTGLGLSIARQLVELQGGEMDISSEEGKGSVFSFILKFEKPAETALNKIGSEKMEIDYDRIRNLHILLAEDNPINVKLIRNIFDQYAIRIDVAENGQEVLSLIGRKQYNLILMDMDMPVLNGYETTRIIRKEYRLDVPIFAMTAHAMAGEQEKCIQMGMNDFISKPLNSSELFEKIQHIAIQVNEQQTPGENGSFKPMYRPEENIPEDGQIDLTYLYELSSGNRDFEKEMLTLFIKQVPEELLELQRAYHQKEHLTVKNTAHRMKSSLPLVGIDYMLKLLAQLEEAGRSEQFDRETDICLERLIHKLEACFETIENELNTYD